MLRGTVLPTDWDRDYGVFITLCEMETSLQKPSAGKTPATTDPKATTPALGTLGERAKAGARTVRRADALLPLT
jgi:hypothetical protein